MILNLEAIFCLGGRAYKNFPHFTFLLFRKRLESTSSRHSPIVSIFLLLLATYFLINYYTCSCSGTDCISTNCICCMVNSTICYFVTSCLLVRLPPRGRIARYNTTLCLPS